MSSGGRFKQLDRGLLLSALFISFLIFIAGIAVGYTLNKEKITEVETDMKNIVKDIQNFQLQFLFFDVLDEKATCPLMEETLNQINDKSYKIGSRLTSYGSETEIQDEGEYVELKEEYSRILTSYWLLALKLKQACKFNSSTILFFISKECNRDTNNMCDNQAFVLNYLKERLEENLLVFTLDIDMKEPSVKILQRYYEVERLPTLVINEKVYEGFQDLETMKGILCNDGLCL